MLLKLGILNYLSRYTVRFIWFIAFQWTTYKVNNPLPAFAASAAFVAVVVLRELQYAEFAVDSEFEPKTKIFK